MNKRQELEMRIAIKQALAATITRCLEQIRSEGASFQYRFGVNGIRNDINFEVIRLQNQLKNL